MNIYSFIFKIFWRLLYIPTFIIIMCIIFIFAGICVVIFPLGLIIFGFDFDNDYLFNFDIFLDFIFDEYWEIGDDIAENIDEKNINFSYILNNKFWK